jgi:hypothetical protein
VNIFEIIETRDVVPTCATVLTSVLTYSPDAPSPLWSPTNVLAEDPYFDIDSPILVSQGVMWSDELI